MLRLGAGNGVSKSLQSATETKDSLGGVGITMQSDVTFSSIEFTISEVGAASALGTELRAAGR